MNSQANYYEVLGVREDASAEEIKKAYRRLAKEYHPDSRGGDKKAEEHFKKISEAYSVLGDPQKRQQYDLMRRGGFSGFEGFDYRGPGAGSYRVNFGDNVNDIGDIFSNLFGGGGRQGESLFNNFEEIFHQKKPPRARSADMESTITVPFEMAINGGETIIKTGGDRRVKIKIPAGIEDGKKIRIRGQGAPSKSGAEPGDLYLTIKVAAHPEFERRGNDIHSYLYINMAEAVLGAEVTVKTVSGKEVKLKIPPGTGSAKIFRLPGMGVKAETGPGDHFVRVEIDVPADLSMSQKREFREWARKVGLLK
ncbi:MAG: J domain-containing protein [Calditrichaceae bacterium]|nr:J domain-containing protein [Calditrichia bacterium]NUQ44009.1 J domain-containing protein [Calditrichaceae bacterium]